MKPNRDAAALAASLTSAAAAPLQSPPKPPESALNLVEVQKPTPGAEGGTASAETTSQSKSHGGHGRDNAATFARASERLHRRGRRPHEEGGQGYLSAGNHA